MSLERCTEWKFEVGQDLDWLHGEHYRVARIIGMTDTKLHLEGVSGNTYWMSKKAMLRKMDEAMVFHAPFLIQGGNK